MLMENKKICHIPLRILYIIISNIQTSVVSVYYLQNCHVTFFCLQCIKPCVHCIQSKHRQFRPFFYPKPKEKMIKDFLGDKRLGSDEKLENAATNRSVGRHVSHGNSETREQIRQMLKCRK
ncbi:hypothetical protein TNCV_3808381 [Trichonephila clavipes]|nr:hypothetical protein TNCV_3808381 [Trichonephila clavipes]